MPRTGWGWMVTPEELDSWVLSNEEDVLAVNKPAHVVCHPTKHGPWSSLSSAVREHFHLDPVHLVSRLDRETSGVVLIAKTRAAAAHLRVQGRRNPPAGLENLVRKTYEAILVGELPETVTVDQRLGRPLTGLFNNRQEVSITGQRAETVFEPIACVSGYTYARVWPKTGRMHQIRVHAAWLGHPVAGDKLYPDESLQLEFLETGWTPRLAALLPLDRQALHASSIRILHQTGSYQTCSYKTGSYQTWSAPLPEELLAFLNDKRLL